jgi:PAS domain S-box-containing protein
LVATAIVLTSAAFGTVFAWQAPGLERYSRDWLTRLRGPVPVSGEIAIVAIDDTSIAKLGRFPWPRSLMARAVDAIAAQQPRAIALDVLFTDPTNPADDEALADAIGRARNVTLAAQLTERSVYGAGSVWLNPLPLLAARAAAIGHVNVGTESDGAARQVLIEQSDDAGNAIRAMSVETWRIGNRIPTDAIMNGLHEVTVGPRVIPFDSQPSLVSGPVSVRRAARMTIDYAGPSGAFAAREFSIGELLDGKIPPGALRGKYVLAGATAASLGERFASPFTHYTDAQGNQHGASIPGVEVLANALNTIIEGRFYTEMPEAVSFLFSALAAWLVLALLSISPGRRGLLRHIAAIAGGLALLVITAYICFTQFLVFPPLIAALVSFASAGVLGLAARTVDASARLDQGTYRVLESLRAFGDSPPPNAMAESIVRLTRVSGALLLKSGKVVGAYGFPGPKPAVAPDTEKLPAGTTLTQRQLGDDGLLILVHPSSNTPLRQAVRLAEALGLTSLDNLDNVPMPPSRLLPEGIEEKTRRMLSLNDRIARQADFFHSSMRSVEDGILIAAPDGQIRFANPRAGIILDFSPEALVGQGLAEAMSLPESADAESAADLIGNIVLNRHVFERELTLANRRYTVRMAAVSSEHGSSEQVIGIVASLSDITRQHELAQVRSDVVTLVSHEMRTPLTAIQGMTELLAAYEIEPVRRREMTLAINDEVKRLARMIGDYLDIARLEMGKTPLRRAPIRLESVVERSLLLFEPVAQEKSIRLLRNFDADLPPLLGDADLLSRVFGNLISNALKYSPAGTDISVSIHVGASQIAVSVLDHGYGIPEADIDRIFEKFYRVPRLQDADVPGTGLGLTFVREIVEVHGGTVTVQSTPGAGSLFTVVLPHGSPASGSHGLGS